jgi:WD40 repeat protein
VVSSVLLCVALSTRVGADNAAVLTATSDATKDTTSGAAVQRLAQRPYISSLLFSPDGNSILTFGRNARDEGELALWNAANQELIWSVAEAGVESGQIAFSSDGQLVAASRFSRVQEGPWESDLTLWNARDGKRLYQMKAKNGYLGSLAFTPDTKVLLGIRSWNKNAFDRNSPPDFQTSVDLWNVKTGNQIATIPPGSGLIGLVAMTADGTRIAVTNSAPPRYRRSFVLTADGKRIASTNSVSEPTNGPTFVRIYDPRTRELKGTLTVSDLEPRALAWSPDASLIALSLGGSVARPQKGQDDAELVLFDVAKGKLKTKLIGHSGDVYAVAFSPDGKLLASGGRDSHVRLWDVETGKLLCAVVADCDLVRGLAFSPDGKVLGSGGDDGAKLWNVETLLASASQVPHLRILPSIVGSLYSIIWSPDGKTIATGGSHSARIGKGTGLNPAGNIRLWDVAEGTERASLTSEPYYVKGLAYSPDGKLLASSTTKGTDEIVSVWDTATDTIAKKLKASHRVHAIAISPDGKTLAGAGVSTQEPYNSSSHAVEPDNRELLGTANETGHVVTSVAFSPDGKTIATSGKAYKEGALTGGAIWVVDSGDGGLKRKIESEDKIGWP